jgi:hypothetical protein
MTLKTIRGFTLFFPSFLENGIGNGLPMGARLPMGDYAFMTFITIGPDWTFLARSAGFSYCYSQQSRN